MLTIGKDPETWLVRRVLEQRAAERPDHPVIHWEGLDYTYTAINREANRIAEGLAARGIEPGHRCAVMMQNTPAHVFVWFATAKLGVVEVPINTAYRGDILTHIVTSARATAMVLDAEFVPVVARIADRCPGLGTFIVAGADLPRTPTQKVRKVVLREEGITAATWDREAAGFKVTRDGLARRS